MRGLARGIGYPLAGQFAGSMFESAVGPRSGTLDDAIRNAFVGAGTGAGVGSFVPGIGTGVGAVVGGLTGFAHGLLTGRGSKEEEAQKELTKQIEEFNKVFDQYQVSPQVREQMLMQFQLGAMDLGRKEIKDFATQLRTQVLPGVILEDAAMQEEERGRMAMYAAAQAWMQPMLERAFTASDQYAQQLSQSMLQTAQQIQDPNERALAIQEAQQVPLDNATRQAYLIQQMLAVPGLYGYQTEVNSEGIPAMDMTSIMNATPVGTTAGVTAVGGPGGFQIAAPGVVAYPTAPPGQAVDPTAWAEQFR